MTLSSDGSGRTPSIDPAAMTHEDLVKENVGLHRRLDSLPVIEEAKGMVMAHFGVDADGAFGILCRWSSHNNLKLVHIATMLVRAAGETSRDREGLQLDTLSALMRRLDQPSASREVG